MTKTLTIVWYFYKPLLALNLFFSGLAIWQLDTLGLQFIPLASFIKVVGYSGAIFYKHYFANKNYIYFMNAGYDIKAMYTYAFGLDFVCFSVMVGVYSLVK
jgi:hypothetical protein